MDDKNLAWIRELGGEATWTVQGSLLVLEGIVDPGPEAQDPVGKREVVRRLQVWMHHNPLPAFLSEEGMVRVWTVQVLPLEEKAREEVVGRAWEIFLDSLLRLNLFLDGQEEYLQGPVALPMASALRQTAQA